MNVLIFDRSDPISGQQAQRVKFAVDELKRAANFGYRFDIYTFESDTKTALEPILKICSPGRPEEANEIIQNPEIIRRRYEKRFSGTLDKTIDSLLKAASRDNSPIIESLRAATLTSFGPITEGQTRLHVLLVSDMVQHSAQYSQFKADSNFQQLARTPGWAALRPNLNLEAQNKELRDRVSLLSSVNADAIRGFEDVLKGASRIDPSDPPALLRRALSIIEHSGSAQSNLAGNLSMLENVLVRAENVDGESPPQVLEKGLSVLEQFGKETKPEDLRTRIGSAMAAEKAIATVREESDRYRRERDNLMRSGKGSTFPSCWLTDKGDTEYIFEVSIRDTGVVVKDTGPAYRRSDQSWRLLDDFARDTEIPETKFRSGTTKLYNWSREKDCRFFVTMRDQTGPTSKDRYKGLRSLVEQHFYVKQIEYTASMPSRTLPHRKAFPMGGPFVPVPTR